LNCLSIFSYIDSILRNFQKIVDLWGLDRGIELYLPSLKPKRKVQLEKRSIDALAPTRVQTQMSNKHNLVFYVDRELVEKSRNLGFNLSKTFENHLKNLITQFSTVNSMNSSESTRKNCLWWAEPDLNRRPSARQADVLTELDYRPVC
jgi:hypothetical protein